MGLGRIKPIAVQAGVSKERKESSPGYGLTSAAKTATESKAVMAALNRLRKKSSLGEKGALSG